MPKANHHKYSFQNDKGMFNYQEGDPISLITNRVDKGSKGAKRTKSKGKKCTKEPPDKVIHIDRTQTYEEPGTSDVKSSKGVQRYKRIVLDNILDKKRLIQPLPRVKGRECIYVGGPSGSGKSTWVGKYCCLFKKLWPKKDIFLFSKVDKDEALDFLKPIRIPLNDDLIKNPIQMSALEDSLVIFDDIDTVREKRIKVAIDQIRNDILEIGRHSGIYCIITTHLLSRGQDSRIPINESSAITFFPNSGSSQQIRYCLGTYFGLSTKDITKVMKLPSRWVTLYKDYPQYVVYQRGIILVSDL